LSQRDESKKTYKYFNRKFTERHCDGLRGITLDVARLHEASFFDSWSVLILLFLPPTLARPWDLNGARSNHEQANGE
jgi:hypothetical protein